MEKRQDVYYFPESKTAPDQRIAQLEAALIELQEREKERDKSWQPTHDLKKPGE